MGFVEKTEGDKFLRNGDLVDPIPSHPQIGDIFWALEDFACIFGLKQTCPMLLRMLMK